MEYNSEDKELIIEREISDLDKFVIDFISSLEKYSDYVIVSGYVSIITGRSRATEDIDLLIPSKESLDYKKFKTIWEGLEKDGFECINTSSIEEAFSMLQESAIRFSFPGQGVPNMEFKLMSNDIHKYSFNNRIKLVLSEKNKTLFISPFEMQIAYKLMLGSEKDLEDAKHLYDLLGNELDKNELDNLCDRLKVKENLKLIKE